MRLVPKALVAALAINSLFAGGVLAALNPASDTFTSIRTTGHVGGMIPFRITETLDGSTTATNFHRIDTNPEINSEGHLYVEGVADFGDLSVMLTLGGPAGLDGVAQAMFNDHWTISNPSMNGESGEVTLVFDFDGFTTVMNTGGGTVESDEFAGINMIVDINPSKFSNGTRVLSYYHALGSGSVQIDGVQGGLTETDPIPFVYGSGFGIRVIFQAIANSDNAFIRTGSNPYYEYYGGGEIDSIELDFSHTASLGAIVLSNSSGTTVSASSLADYSGLITELPEPSGPVLAMASLVTIMVLAHRRRGRAS